VDVKDEKKTQKQINNFIVTAAAAAINYQREISSEWNFKWIVNNIFLLC